MTLDRRTLLVVLAGLPLTGRARAQGAAQAPSKIGVIGSGRLGGTVGTLLAKAGHPVLFASRRPEELTKLVEGAPGSRAGTVAEAIAFGDALVLAVPYRAYPDLAREHGAALKGRIVLDAGNATAARDGAEILAEVQRDGIGAVSARLLPGARLVRAFNTLGSGVLLREAGRQDGRIAIPIAGDDAGALDAAAALVRDAGFDPVVVGPLSRAPDFAMGARGYGQAVTAAELRRILGLDS
jgi:8-hydroxy-5-deazaflavin:NADPH oxidoreductase